jgi:hypothetical protein
MSKFDRFRIKGRYVILHTLLYGCDTWSVTLTKEHKERIIANSVLRIIFGPEKECDRKAEKSA